MNRLFLFLIIVTGSCTTPGPGLFNKLSPHESYGKKISDAGLSQTALGREWFTAADRALINPVIIKLPYSEMGYFSSDKPASAGFQFSAKTGEKIVINLSKRPVNGFLVYLDLWQTGDQKPKLLLSADTLITTLNYSIKKSGTYIVRVQPELLKSGEYTLTITAQPSLAFPVTPAVKSKVGSVWGDSRDAGARKHEGVDIFAPFRTPLVAAAEGTVSRVNETAIGGKAVWIRPSDHNISLYYAHLDSPLVNPGDKVNEGDVVGLMGNTGNARNTPPHLHFGIYTNDGPVDPLPFINPQNKTPEKILATPDKLYKIIRGADKAKIFDQPATSSSGINAASLPMRIVAATSDWYKVVTPSGKTAFIKTTGTQSTEKPVRTQTISKKFLFEAPDSTSARKLYVDHPSRVEVIGEFMNYTLVRNKSGVDGWITGK